MRKHRALRLTVPALLALALPSVLGCSASTKPTEAELPLRVDVMYPPLGLGDRSYADSVYEGLVKAGIDIDFDVVSASPDDAAAAKTVLADWTQGAPAGRELIVVVGGDRVAMIDAAECNFGTRNVLLLDGALRPCSGAESVVYDVYAASFLAGVAAVTLSPKKRAAVIAGMPDPNVNRFVRGFVAGVEYSHGTLTNVEYLSDTVDGFNDPAKAQSVAEALFQDADAIFPVAGASCMGVFIAARAEPGRNTFGMDVDQSWIAPGAIVGSIVKHLDDSLIDGVRRAAKGTFAPASLSGGPGFNTTIQVADLVLNPLFSEAGAAAIAQARQAAVAAGEQDLEANPW